MDIFPSSNILFRIMKRFLVKRTSGRSLIWDFEIGCAVWCYKEKDFGLMGSHYDAIRQDLLKLWNHK